MASQPGELTDDQWVAELIDVQADLVAGTITPGAAVVRMQAATAKWPTRTLSNLDLAKRMSRFFAQIDGLVAMAGPPTADVGDLNAFYFDTTSGDFYGPKTVEGWGASSFSLIGPRGESAKEVVIAAGMLPAGATDAQFATWIADSQKAAVQPLVNEAKAARDTAVAAKTAAEDAADLAVPAAQAAAADAVKAEAAESATSADRAAVEAAMPAFQAAVDAADQTALDRVATQADREATAEARAVVQAAGPAFAAAVAAAEQTQDDRAATAADRLATGGDRAAVADDRGEVETLRDQTQTLRDQAAQSAAEASAAAGGDFLTQAAADGRYRKLADALGLDDVAGLEAALSGKVDDAELTAAVNALEAALADKADDTDLTAVQQALAGKVSQGTFDALAEQVAQAGQTLAKKADLVDGKIPAAQLPNPPTVPVKATGAEVRAGTDDAKFPTSKALVAALDFVPLVDAAVAAINLGSGKVMTLTTTAGVGATRTLGAPSGGAPGLPVVIDIVVGAAGHVWTYSTAFVFPGGTVPAASTEAGKRDKLIGQVNTLGTIDVTGYIKGL